MTAQPLQELTDAGVAVWLDDLDRHRIRSGALLRLTQERCVVGVTTNPSIFAASLQGKQKDAYDEQVGPLAKEGQRTVDVLRAVTTTDVREACDVLAGVVAATGGLDGRVSIEVDAGLAHDGDGTFAQAKELWTEVGRPNLFVKIPATQAGLGAISNTIAEGISVNVTLIFSLERYRAVIDAWLTGLERLVGSGASPAGVASVASFFVSRVDTMIDPMLDEIGTPEAAALRGRAALANARLAYEIFEETQASPRWAALAEAGALVQRPLWASTGVKDPTYPDTLYVDGLVAPHTVNTMPEKTMEAVADHGTVVPNNIQGTYDDARAVLAGLAEVGISYDQVVADLETEGVKKFADAWDGLVEATDQRLKDLSA